MNKQKKKSSKIKEMVKEDLLTIGKVKDVSLSMKKFNKICSLKTK